MIIIVSDNHSLPDSTKPSRNIVAQHAILCVILGVFSFPLSTKCYTILYKRSLAAMVDNKRSRLIQLTQCKTTHSEDNTYFVWILYDMHTTHKHKRRKLIANCSFKVKTSIIQMCTYTDCATICISLLLRIHICITNIERDIYTYHTFVILC